MNPKTDVKSEDYSLVESLWEGSCIHTGQDPHDLKDKTRFFAGAWAVLLALRTCVDDGEYCPDMALDGMLADCRRFFDETRQDLKTRDARIAAGTLS